MSQTREPKVKPLTMLVDKLRATSPLRFRDGPTPRGVTDIQMTAIDTQTGQTALITILPINDGICPGCAHVGHAGFLRCEAITFLDNKPCRCDVFGRFPKPNDDEEKVPA